MYFWLIFSSILATVTLSSPTFASPVTWEFTGEVTSVRDDDNLLGGQVVIGSPFSGVFTFESTTFDVAFDNPNIGFYSNAIDILTGTVGLVPFIGPTGPSSVSVINDSSIGFEDVYGISSIINFINTMAFFEIVLIDKNGTVFLDDILTINSPKLHEFESAEFLLFSSDGKGSPITRIEGVVTSLVPEPNTLILLSLGAGMIFKRKRL